MLADFDSGDGGDSDEEGDEADDHNDPNLRRSPHLIHRPSNRPDPNNPEDMDMEDEDDIAGTIDLESTDLESTSSSIPGAPRNWTPPGPPEGFQGYAPKPESGAPEKFEDVDNPAGWSPYSFYAKYGKDKKYQYHRTPCGARVVPVGANGKREVDGWEFFYDGWEPDDRAKSTYRRGNASRGNMKPSERDGYLDVDVLKKYGVTAKSIKEGFHLLFLNMLLPIHEIDETGIEDDNRMPFWAWASRYTNAYAGSGKRGSGYGHKWETVEPYELIRFAGVPIRNGSLDGRPGSIYKRWDKTSPMHDEETANSMTVARFQMIKRNLKLCHNMQATPRGQPGYDPCFRYDFILKSLVFNTNQVTKKAPDDATGDETTWGYGGFSAECGGRLVNKPFSKGEPHFEFERHR